MTRDELEGAIKKRPFRPFRLRMADGFRYAIDLPDQVMLHPLNVSTRTAVISTKDGGYDHVDVGFAVALEFDADDADLVPPDEPRDRNGA